MGAEAGFPYAGPSRLTQESEFGIGSLTDGNFC